jgi:hypothetical protein
MVKSTEKESVPYRKIQQESGMGDGALLPIFV